MGDGAVGRLAHGGEQRAQRLGGLEVAQTGRVGRGDVDDEVVRVGGEALGGLHVVGGCVGLGDHLGLADVDADGGAEDRVARGQPGGDGGRALVVEAHAVDQRAVRDQAEQALLRVAGLRLAGHGADLDVVEAEHRHAVDRDRVLVEAGGEPEGTVHPQAQGLGAQLLVPGGEGGGHEGAQHGDACGQADPAEGQVVGALGVHALEDQLEEELVHHGVLMKRGTPFPVSPCGLPSRGPRSSVPRVPGGNGRRRLRR